jgi:4-hydroxybenzoate polyprenyltransferase
VHSIVKLSRWQEHIPFTVPVTLLGGLMAYHYANAELDLRLLWVLLANCLAVGYAFIINDIEDAEDDRHEAGRGSRNAIANGEISKPTGWVIGVITVVAAVLLYGLAGTEALIIGVVILVLGHLYSWKPVRLKALPIVDILSHILFLAALLMLGPYMIYDASPREVLLLAVSVALFSAYGQFYNQVRDYEADRAAGLKNTASVLGKQVTQILSYLAIPIAAICLLIPIIDGAFPLWLAGVILVMLPLVRLIARGRDMRGDKTEDAMADVQVQFLIVVNVTLIAWLVVIIFDL